MAEDNNDKVSTAYLPGGKHTSKNIEGTEVTLALIFASKRSLTQPTVRQKFGNVVTQQCETLIKCSHQDTFK